MCAPSTDAEPAGSEAVIGQARILDEIRDITKTYSTKLKHKQSAAPHLQCNLHYCEWTLVNFRYCCCTDQPCQKSRSTMWLCLTTPLLIRALSSSKSHLTAWRSVTHRGENIRSPLVSLVFPPICFWKLWTRERSPVIFTNFNREKLFFQQQ